MHKNLSICLAVFFIFQNVAFFFEISLIATLCFQIITIFLKDRENPTHHLCIEQWHKRNREKQAGVKTMTISRDKHRDFHRLWEICIENPSRTIVVHFMPEVY